MGDPKTAIVVGGGLAGLSAALRLAKAGWKVRLLERSEAIGGRARTHEKEGFFLNQGAHALYLGGPSMRSLRAFGIRPDGGIPQGGCFAQGEVLHRIPAFPWDILRMSTLSWGQRLRLGWFFAKLLVVSKQRAAGMTAEAWIAKETVDPTLRKILGALVRVATYCGSVDTLEGAVALEQLQIALKKGVMYLHGGWGRLVEALAEKARQAGVTLQGHARVTSLSSEGSAPDVRYSLQTEGGEIVEASAVVLAIPPQEILSILPLPLREGLQDKWKSLIPIHAACLDVALRRVPRPDRFFVLDVEEPLYFSIASKVARLTPDAQGGVLHLLAYLKPGESSDASALQERLEAILDRHQEGWRDEVVIKRFLPKMPVSFFFPKHRDHAGLPTRPDVRLPGLTNVVLAGDWVGEEGHLADASFASAEKAASALCRDLSRR